MSTTTKASPRERLVAAAAELFYRDGITATGVEKLCQAAGISKRSMYQLFDTKDQLVAESVELLAAATEPAYPRQDAVDRQDAVELSPRERILYVFEWLEKRSGETDFHGCPMVNTATELRDPAHPAKLAARRHKQRLTDFFARQAALGGARDPELLGKQLTVVFDGSAARTATHGTDVAGLAVLTASALLDAGGMPAGTPTPPDSQRR